MNLYKSDKYKVILGNKTNLALCTCWMDPLSVIGKYPNIKDLFSITGTLYSKEGVSIILRNLALNPNIRYLILWGNTPLSNTPFGIAGRTLLKEIWNSLKDMNDIIDSSSIPDLRILKDIHKEIDIYVLKKIVSNVTLLDLSDKPFEELITYISDNVKDNSSSNNIFSNSDFYMDPIDFLEPVRNEFEPLKSEKVGWVVRSDKLYNSWLHALDRILRYGHIKKTEYGSLQRELHNINWVIEKDDPNNIFKPDINEDVLNMIGMSNESLAKYKESLLDPTIPEGTSYTYGSRLRDYFDPDLNNFGFDQVEMIIQKLNETNISRRAMATTILPNYDSKQKSPPCFVFVQVLTDDADKLNMFATFRSHDIFKAALPNAYGLLNLQEYVCSKTKLKRGVLSINSVSAHIYEDDWNNAYQLIKCQKWEDVSTKYDENTDTDPRGIVRIFVENKDIVLEIVSPNGEVIYSDRNSTARNIIMKLAKLDLLSRVDHYIDICIELIKADICIQTDMPYQQDKPLNINNILIR